jgi:hypothetical protein
MEVWLDLTFLRPTDCFHRELNHNDSDNNNGRNNNNDRNNDRNNDHNNDLNDHNNDLSINYNNDFNSNLNCNNNCSNDLLFNLSLPASMGNSLELVLDFQILLVLSVFGRHPRPHRRLRTQHDSLLPCTRGPGCGLSLKLYILSLWMAVSILVFQLGGGMIAQC